MGLLAARAGRSTLIVSTDPAPSLGDALEQRLTRRPRPVRGVPRLEAVEVDAPAALAEWLAGRRARLEAIALRGTWLDRDDVTRLLRLSLPGIDEIAGLLQIGGFAASGRYEHIIVDTAPTGHLLRMLGMPAILEAVAELFDRMQAKHRTMVEALGGGWTPDDADALLYEIDAEARRLGALLRDPRRCRMTWITLPERLATEETIDALRALGEQHIMVDRVIVNRMTPAPRRSCPWCERRRSLERQAIRVLSRRLEGSNAVIGSVPAVLTEPRGIRALRGIARQLAGRPMRVAARPAGRGRLIATVDTAGASLPLREIVPPGAALVLFGGKGGVGKTTCAAAAALAVARSAPGRRVLLLSADPAHSLGDALATPVSNLPRRLAGGPPNLLVRELAAAEAFEVLRARFARGVDELVLRIGGSAGDGQAFRDLLDLAPPGVDELVAILDVTETLSGGDGPAAADLVLVDTAPTGHALRLLAMPALVHDWVKAMMAILLKYQTVTGLGDLGAALLRLSRGLGRLRTLLGDARRTRFVVVTRAAALPRVETARLLDRLDAASIAAPLIIVNAVGAGPCVRCQAERAQQRTELRALARSLSRRPGPLLLLAPAIAPPPTGQTSLHQFFQRWRRFAGPVRG